MNKTFTLTTALLVGGLIIYDAPDAHVHGRLDGAPAGRTGSPGDNSTCFNGCHGNSPGNGMANESTTITHNIPGTGYAPGTTYDMTVTTTSMGTNSFGFTLSPQDASGTILGTLISGSDSQLNGGGGYITHTENIATNMKSWNFQWTAPTANTGEVTFYCASIYGNSSLTNVGDFMVLQTEMVQEDNGVGIFDPGAESVVVYPNPAVDVIRISAELKDQTAFELIDLRGSVVQSGILSSGSNPSIAIDRTAVNSGMHLLRLSNELGSNTTRMLVQ